MDERVREGYDLLVPADQLVIDAMIGTLLQKDRTISDLVADVHKRLDKEEQENETPVRKRVRRRRSR